MRADADGRSRSFNLQMLTTQAEFRSRKVGQGSTLRPPHTTPLRSLDSALLLGTSMSAFTYLITGASRSLGLGYTRQLLKSGNHVRVVAGARNPSSAAELQALRKEVGDDRLYILKLDVEDESAIAASVKELESSGFLKDGSLDCLINNAGVARGHGSSPSQT